MVLHVEGVDVVSESMETLFITGPNEENVINKAPPYLWTAISRV